MMKYKTTSKKPEDWPANNSELRIDEIVKKIEKFRENPNYVNREVLLALVTFSNVNEVSGTGVLRVTDYEIELLNYIYYSGKMMNNTSLISYVYLHCKMFIQSTRMFVNMGLLDDLNIEFNGIVPQVQYFNYMYLEFKEQDSRNFIETLVKSTKREISCCQSKEELVLVENILTNCILDISIMNNKELLHITKLNFKDINSLIDLLINLHNKLGKSPVERPQRGVMAIIISRLILGNRNENYDIQIYKYLPDIAVENAIDNNEIWMNDVKNLNDKREGKVINELFTDKSWVTCDWAKKIDLNPNDIAYVSSFSKSKPTEELEEKYGSNYFGYMTDRLLDIITPFYKEEWSDYFYSTALAYDILYDREEMKEELNTLIGIIDKFKVSDEEKLLFLNSIIKYWHLSFKDSKWSGEEERRYHIILDVEIEKYYGTKIEDGFLKTESTLFKFPDFTSSKNIKHSVIDFEKRNKDRYKIFNQYQYCNDCLYSDAQILSSTPTNCCLCDSENTEIINKKSGH